jgi:hypothetical protein
MKKIILTAAALVALAASPALAKSHQAQSAATAAEASAFEPSYIAASPTSVVVDGQVIGEDPDPNIRAQIARDPAPWGF